MHQIGSNIGKQLLKAAIPFSDTEAFCGRFGSRRRKVTYCGHLNIIQVRKRNQMFTGNRPATNDDATFLKAKRYASNSRKSSDQDILRQWCP